MTRHLMNNTLGLELTQIVAHFAREGLPEEIINLGQAIVQERITYEEGLEALMARWEHRNPPPTDEALREMDDKHKIWVVGRKVGRWTETPQWEDLEEKWERKWLAAERLIGHRLDVVVDRIERGLLNASLAVVRTDIHTRVRLRLGIPDDGLLTNKEISAMLAGRHADGDKIVGKQYASPRPNSTPIGSYDFIPMPDKSISVAWAFAQPAERAQIASANLEASRDAVRYIGTVLGVARTGRGGLGPTEAGHVGWLEFTHHTTRPRAGARGDPELHTHFVIPNAVFTDSGRVGSLNTAALRRTIYQVDEYYHARLGHYLRKAGFAAEMDQKTGVTKMSIIPDKVQTLFSKSTVKGKEIAKAEAGKKWETLPLAEQRVRIKDVVQSKEQKIKGGRDDVADIAGWVRQAKEDAGWEAPQTMKLYGPQIAEPKRAKELQERFGSVATDAAAAILERVNEIRRSAVAVFQMALQGGAEKARHALMERRMRRVLAMGIKPRGPKNERDMGM